MTIEERNTAKAIQDIAKELKSIRKENDRIKIIDWEKRRYEIARECLPQLLKMEIPSGDFIDYEIKLQGKKPIVKGEYSLFMRACVEMAIDCADLLIDRLKKGGEK